ncbi:MAG: hypothetical protein II464_09185 [Oscillospiraceae bacterium]|nr:hypothetical protein [Oscillospiraceae bacterium]
MAFQDLTLSSASVRIFIPDSDYDTLIYIPVSDPNSLNAIIDRFASPSFAAAAVVCDDWDSQMTPWPAPAAFKGRPDFGGKADAFLDAFYREIVPAVEDITGEPDFRGMAGYSLAGLFSLYSFYNRADLRLCGCVSGSVWYDGFEDWALERIPLAESGSVFFSLGNREEKTRNVKMQHTGEMMRKITEHLNSESDRFEASFRYTSGTHFDGYEDRMHECISWLIGESS